MLRYTLGIDFGFGSWPGPLGDGDAAVVGERWTGPGGLLDALELYLGLSRKWPSDASRVARLVPRLKETDRFWSEAAELDPLGTARALLDLRDELWASGWRGEGVTGRLEQLAAVTEGVEPGVPDRLDQVARALESRRVPFTEIRLVEGEEVFGEAWQRVFEGLRAYGVAVVPYKWPTVEARGTLRTATTASFEPELDGTLQLLRSAGPWVAAEQVAAWLASVPEGASKLIISPEPVLDEALRRYGMPVVGGRGKNVDNILLQILPLVLELGWDPPDPQRVLELLLLPVSPIPSALRRRLAWALHERPAVGSDVWEQAKKEGLKEHSERYADRHAAVKERVNKLLTPVVQLGQGYPRDEIQQRIAEVRKWLHGYLKGKQEGAEEGEPLPAQEHWEAAVVQCESLSELVALSGIKDFTRPQLEKFIQQATETVPAVAEYQPEAGLGSIGRPGGMAGGADYVVWWNFTRAAAEYPARLALTSEEMEALRKAGVKLRDTSAEAVWLAKRWERPLKLTRKALLLVCPVYDSSGEPAFPHPLWDELLGRARERAKLRQLMVHEPSAVGNVPRCAREPLKIPEPQEEYRVRAGSVPRREQESPSGAATLVSCPLKWVLEYGCKVRPGLGAKLNELDVQAGNLAHEIFAEVLRQAAGVAQLPTGDELRNWAVEEAERLFEEQGPKIAAALFMPGAIGLKECAKRACCEGVAVLLQALKDSGLRVRAVEEWVREVEALGMLFHGRPDLVVVGEGDSLAVVDIKWSGERYRREQLAQGTAAQLAAYCYLVAPEREADVPGGYFILRTRHLLSTVTGGIKGAITVEGRPLSETWRGLVNAYRNALTMVENGVVKAPGNEAKPPKSRLLNEGNEPLLILEPECRFCDYRGLCGQD